MWILISWLLMKPADLDLHCFQTGGYKILVKVACPVSALIRLELAFVQHLYIQLSLNN